MADEQHPKENLKQLLEDGDELIERPMSTRIHELKEQRSQVVEPPDEEKETRWTTSAVEGVCKSTKAMTEWMSRISRQLELLSWTCALGCAVLCGGKFASKQWSDAVYMLLMALIFANNGARLPRSKVNEWVTMIFDGVPDKKKK